MVGKEGRMEERKEREGRKDGRKDITWDKRLADDSV